MKIRLFTLSLLLISLLCLAGCTQTVENQEMTLDMTNLGEHTGIYSGEIKDGLPNGEGSFDTENRCGDKYIIEGTWVNGQVNGDGVMDHYVTGYKFVGDIVDNLMDGHGEEYKDDILYCDGNYTKGVRNGHCVFYDNDGNEVFEGDFENGHISLESIKDKTTKIIFNELSDSIDEYFGSFVNYTGKIYEVLESDGTYTEFIICDESSEENLIYCFYYYDEGEEELSEGDIVTIYGRSDGTIGYQAEDNEEEMIPCIDVFATINSHNFNSETN